MRPPGATRRLPGGRFHSAPQSCSALLSPRWGRRDDPGPLSPLDHMAFLCSLPSCSGVGLFLMVVVIVPKVSESLPLPWLPSQGLVSSSVTKAALDLDSPGREVAGSGGCSRRLSLVLLQPLPHWAHKWALSSKQNRPPTQATQARGPRPHRGKGVVTDAPDKFSSPRFSPLFPATQVLILAPLPFHLHPESPNSSPSPGSLLSTLPIPGRPRFCSRSALDHPGSCSPAGKPAQE